MDFLPNYLMDTNDEDAMIYETSFVEDPATGFDFLKFSNGEIKTKTMEFKKVETTEFKRMVSGVWFMPDTKYLRYDKNRGLYTVEFKRESLKEALIKYLKNDFANNVKVEHNGDYLKGFVAIEHWIYDEDNKVSPIFKHTLSDLGYLEEQVKYGTVFKTVFIKDEQFWNDEVLTGKVKGFSIGGLFTLEEEEIIGTQMFSSIETPVETVIETPIVENVSDDSIELIVEKEDDLIESISESIVENVTESVAEKPINDTNLLDLIKDLQLQMLSIKESLNDKEAKNALLTSELSKLTDNQKQIEQENETLKKQVLNTPINKQSFNPIVKKDTQLETEGKKNIGGYWV